jgi:hypothetical protein
MTKRRIEVELRSELRAAHAEIARLRTPDKSWLDGWTVIQPDIYDLLAPGGDEWFARPLATRVDFVRYRRLAKHIEIDGGSGPMRLPNGSAAAMNFLKDVRPTPEEALRDVVAGCSRTIHEGQEMLATIRRRIALLQTAVLDQLAGEPETKGEAR